jgi:hypothetical protein
MYGVHAVSDILAAANDNCGLESVDVDIRRINHVHSVSHSVHIYGHWVNTVYTLSVPDCPQIHLGFLGLDTGCTPTLRDSVRTLYTQCPSVYIQCPKKGH